MTEEENKKKTEKTEEELAETLEEEETEELPEEEAKEEVKEEIKKEAKEEAETSEEAVEAEAAEEEAPEAAEKEEKAEPREKKPEEEEIVEERIYTVPLGKAWIMPPRKRTPRAVRMLKRFIIKHMKMEARKGEEGEEEEEPAKLVISNEVNEKMWGRGVEKPPRKVRVRAAKDKDGNVTVYLAEGD